MNRFVFKVASIITPKEKVRFHVKRGDVAFSPQWEVNNMAQGDKSKYTSKQKRQARHIETGYEKRGTGRKEAAKRAWATVNKMTGGGKNPGGSGRGKSINKSPARKGGKIGGRRSR